MTLLNRIYTKTRENIERKGISGIPQTVSDILFFLERQFRSRLNSKMAVNIYERDWDLLILLDCATIKMMREVKDEYEFLTEIGELMSVGTTSPEWMRNTFINNFYEEMKNTMYITGNTSSEIYLEDSMFLHLEEVWKDGWEKEVGTIPAKEITDRAIFLSRRQDADRTILHYMQPHPPFVTASEIEAGDVTRQHETGEGMNLRELYFKAEYTRDELWDAHIENLRYVLDSVELLLSNVSADRVVISADHGQAFGEKGVWGHPASAGVNQVRKVPWCVTAASDSGAYVPDRVLSKETNAEGLSREKKLEHLGYL
jgi:hypothetical protein